MSRNSIEECIVRSLDKYFRDLNGERPTGLYEMLMHTVERPLLEVVMREADDNQSLASEMLGINRNTLRKKLQSHGLL
ncbi:Fis family transcriptional regulator [soil metagenome]